MALVSKVCETIAAVEGIAPATAALAARYAREAGFLSQGARGVNAPDATVSDCTNLLIALNAVSAIKDVPTMLPVYRRMRSHSPAVHKDHPSLGFLNQNVTPFGDILDNLISRFIIGDIQQYIIAQSARLISQHVADEIPATIHGATSNHIRNMIKRAEDLIDPTRADIRVIFRSPTPSAVILVNGFDLGGDRKEIAGIKFIIDSADLVSGVIDGQDFDRRNEVSIGYRTLKAIAEVMRK
jgi:hypothetical protein